MSRSSGRRLQSGARHDDEPDGGRLLPGRATHTYYIAADEVTWDFCAVHTAEWRQRQAVRRRGEAVGRAADHHKIGKCPRQALYREYTDATFTQLKPRPQEWEHLGLARPADSRRGWRHDQDCVQEQPERSARACTARRLLREGPKRRRYNDGCPNPAKNRRRQAAAHRLTRGRFPSAPGRPSTR